jgi:hypothetical protein
VFVDNEACCEILDESELKAVPIFIVAENYLHMFM